MLIDADLLALREKAEAGDLEAQIEMCCIYHRGYGTPVDYQKAIHYASLILSHKPDTLEKDGREYETLLWAIGRFYIGIDRPFDALLCYRKATKYIQDTYVTESAQRLLQFYKLQKYIAEIIPPEASSLWLNGIEIMRYEV